MADESLQAEVERLRAEVESFRQRELSDLRSQLAAARQDAERYREDAYRNANAGKQIYAEAQESIARLRSELDAARRIGLETARIRNNANAG